MTPAALVLLAPLALAAGAPPPPDAVRLEAALSASESFRRLLAAGADAPRREARASGLPLAVDERGGARPEVVLDLERLRGLEPAEAEAEYALALARAAVAAPVPLVEAEQACWQRTAQVLVELAARDAGLSRMLAAAESAPWPDAPVLSRAAAYLALFERDPRAFYWAVESGGGLPREAERLTDIEDLLALRAAEVRALAAPPEGPYGELAGRRYPARLVRAAYRLRSGGELERLREALDAYDSVGVGSLQAALARWRKADPRP